MELIISRVLEIYELILLARIFMSWIHPDPYNPIVRFITSITDPVLVPIRNMLPDNRMGIDFSPIIVFMLIGVIRKIIFSSYGYGF